MILFHAGSGPLGDGFLGVDVFFVNSGYLIEASFPDGTNIRIFDDAGDFISADRVHITKTGAKIFATRLKDHPGIQRLRQI